MLGLRALNFAIRRHRATTSQFVIEKVALGRPNLWIFSLHLNLLVKLGRYLPGWSVNTRTGSIGCLTACCAAIADAVRLWLLHVDRRPVVRTGCLGEEIVLVAWCLQVLMPGRLHVLGSWNLNLDIWSVGCLLGDVLLLACWTVEILGGLVHELVGRCAAHGQINMLGGAAPGRTCPPLRRVVPVSLHALDKLSSLWIDFGKWIH